MSKGKIFVQEFVIGVGLLGGLFARIGTDPEALLLETTSIFLKALNPNNQTPPLLWLLPSILTLILLFPIYLVGRWLGLLAVGIAYVGGYFLLNNPFWCSILIIIAAVMGFFAPYITNGNSSQRVEYPYY